MAETILLPEQSITTTDQFMGLYLGGIAPPPFTLELGKTYKVIWDGNEYTSSAWDASLFSTNAIGVGNGTGFNQPENDEPFIVVYSPDVEVLFASMTDAEPTKHTVAVYQVDEESGGEEETASPIVLKDRTGTGIEHEGVEGVRLFDKDGNAHVFMPPAETEEKTVELDFSSGAMEVTPTAGKMLSKVGIPVPGNLLPENIAKDVDIAGVVGTHEGGGGGMVPYIFTTVYSKVTRYQYQSSPTNSTLTHAVSLPSNATVHGFAGKWLYTYASSGTTQVTTNGYAAVSKPEIYNQGAYRYAKFSYTSDKKSGYGVEGLLVAVNFSVPGVYQMPYGEGTMVYADETAKSWPNTSQTFGSALNVLKIDLSKTSLTSLPPYLFLHTAAQEICLPATTTSIAATALSGFSGTLDLSLCTAVPTLAAGVLTAADTLKIRVPAALYDSWIAAANWSTYASYIVPV